MRARRTVRRRRRVIQRLLLSQIIALIWGEQSTWSVGTGDNQKTLWPGMRSGLPAILLVASALLVSAANIEHVVVLVMENR